MKYVLYFDENLNELVIGTYVDYTSAYEHSDFIKSSYDKAELETFSESLILTT